MKFTALHLHDNLLKGIADAGFTDCTPVQEQTLVHSLKGKDVTVQSQTGTGKTAAFLITIFQHFLAGGPIKKNKALIVAPTRELAVQIEKEARMLGVHLDFTMGSFYGGIGYTQQEKLLREDVNMIIGTPGRLLDLGQKRLLDFTKIGYLVIDEADRLFDMGFYPDIRRILKKMLPYTQRQTMLFSATLDVDTRQLASEFMNEPVRVELSPEQITVENVTQEIYHVAKKEKISLLLGLLKKEKPRIALIFTNTKYGAVMVARHLENNGFKCQYLIGDLPQKKRLKIIDDFKAGDLSLLIATDVASRGLHIEDLELIVNYDLPEDCENYVHRIGRTARAGKSGKAIALACEDCVFNLDAIEKFIGMKIPVKYVTDDIFSPVKPLSIRSGARDQQDRPRMSRGRADDRGGRPGEHRTRPQGQRPRPEARQDRPKGPAARPPEQRPRPEDRKDRPQEQRARPPERRPRPEGRPDRPREQKPRQPGQHPRPEERKDRPKGIESRPAEQRSKPVDRQDRSREQKVRPPEHRPRSPERRERPGEQKDRPSEQKVRPPERRERPVSGQRAERWKPKKKRDEKKVPGTLSTLQDHVEYYQEKYGEHLRTEVKVDKNKIIPEKKSILEKLSTLFKKK